MKEALPISLTAQNDASAITKGLMPEKKSQKGFIGKTKLISCPIRFKERFSSGGHWALKFAIENGVYGTSISSKTGFGCSGSSGSSFVQFIQSQTIPAQSQNAGSSNEPVLVPVVV